MSPQVPGRRKGRLIVSALILTAVGACTAQAPAAPSAGSGASRTAVDSAPFRPRFSSGVYLLTNELAYFDPSAGAPVDKNWIVTSGSLFNDNGTGWTGPIDSEKPDQYSHRHTDSAVFRVVTRRDFQDVTVRFDLDVTGLTSTPRTPPQSYDGVHVFVRYQTQRQLYVVSVFRRDGEVVIKKKVSGGDVNGGTYATLAAARHPLPAGKWIAVAVSAVNTSDGVLLTLSLNDNVVLRTTDLGTEGSPLYPAGRVGIRGDNAEFRFRDFSAISP
jgi:hypothetical protein